MRQNSSSLTCVPYRSDQKSLNIHTCVCPHSTYVVCCCTFIALAVHPVPVSTVPLTLYINDSISTHSYKIARLLHVFLIGLIKSR
jgi:hypothetical protein